MELSGKRIIVTDGGSGIGLALARRLADSNEVVITGRDEARLARAQADMPGPAHTPVASRGERRERNPGEDVVAEFDAEGRGPHT